MTSRTSHLIPENLELQKINQKFRTDLAIKPELLWPWYRPCTVRLLLVVDGLDFSDADFGLATFVRILLDTGGRVRFKITLASLEAAPAAAMMSGENRISDRYTNFKFDDTDEFTSDMYDVVFIFGIKTSMFGRGAGYPTNRLSDAELQAIAEFQNSGGGLFATGDHGALGKFMGQSLARARNMRLWDSTSGNTDLDEVSMGGQRRNDTNVAGDMFTDQSDDVPQTIQPRMYTASNGLFQYSYPHPVLCGPNGPIRVMPDHPHEGECITPLDPNQSLNFTGNLGPEYPPAKTGGARPLPEIISTNFVPAGNTAGTKAPTIAHSFGGICAYDGHRAGVGRVITDATWHHFVSINLVGDIGEPPGTVKAMGFLFSASGQAHFETIKAYYRNLGMWLARPENIR